MYGVSKISIEPSLMMISVQDVEFKGNSLARYLQIFADTGVVVDMISQSAPHGTTTDKHPALTCVLQPCYLQQVPRSA